MPGLSKAPLDTLQAVQMARLTAEIPREGDSYDAQQRRKEKLVAAAWHKGRANPRIANELDASMSAASQRLGEEGERAALRAAFSGRWTELPGVGREHRDQLNTLARGFALGREGMTLSPEWGRRVERKAQETARWQARQEDRECRGLPPEPEQDRERDRHRSRGLER